MGSEWQAALIDHSQAIDAIKRKYGPRYFVDPEAFAEAATLWGANCNEHGVVSDVTERIEVKHERCSAEVRLCRTAKGFWLIGLSLTLPQSGFGTPPTVWDVQGFSNGRAARHWAIEYLIERIVRNSQLKEPTRAEFVRSLQAAKTPQLSLGF